MGLFLLAVLLFSTFGVVLLSTQGLANPLDTPSNVSKMGSLQVFDSSDSTLLGLNLGTSDAISSVTLTFDSNIPEDTTVTISLKDANDVEIGTGSTVTGSPTQTVVISLSDSITDPERRTLQYASITIA
ncbi:hypothetical protein NZNM25_15060 [Nitrosopumilus zosterae]|uniref:Uncharacterized protein n=1 Tax=Nitrosopumilus zosterae TaxID=718286 RepID=A0A2S2KTC6_9ARCH|nr:hypothetical protein [Nitrosopumilus zosterae]BDQ30672.1 hypothetical protein NZOSNM25_000778 [Nitrosopumilus zosterae]GBH34715.1 hypothetical protein NZNM25_15060 [Nitrosopumilus zosterae]